MKSKILRMGQEYDGEITATFAVPRPQADEIHALIGQDVSVEVKKWREKRSLSANALMWAVCEELAQALKITKVEVYRRAIKDVGSHYRMPIPNAEIDKFCADWSAGGVGWFAEIIDDSKIPDYKLVFAYPGSSTYDSLQMSRLVDWLIDEAEQIGIVLKAGPELEQKAKELGL